MVANLVSSLAAVGLTVAVLQEAGDILLVDVAEELGVTRSNISGSPRNEYILEANGNGAAFFDHDMDGDLDLLITNGSTLQNLESGGDPVGVLYENSDGRFLDISQVAGFVETGWAFGACVADYDNDGDSDFYVTAYGPNFLYQNNGDGTYREVAEEAGVGDSRWGTNCAFGDYDRDGHVDLYVANYLAFDLDTIPRGGPSCRYMGIVDVFCGPRSLPGEADVLYRNDGDGTFTDVTDLAGIVDPGYYGFGVVISDLDNDGWPDIYVANDSLPNFLFRNNRDGTFSPVGLISGASVSGLGHAQAGMGVAVADYDGNGLFDIFVTNFAQDTNTLYENLGDFLFLDASVWSGAVAGSRRYVGWGTGFADFDNDGWRDLFVANGHVYPGIDALDIGSPYLQPKEVYRNLGDGSFQEITSKVGSDLTTPRSARGAAFGDYDSDGDIDVVVINMNEPPDLYRNEQGNRAHWIGFRLEGVASNRDAIGARVEIDAGGRTRVAEVRSGGSYLSHNDMRVFFGLGQWPSVDRIRVAWPSGTVQAFDGVPAGRYLTIREGAPLVRGEP